MSHIVVEPPKRRRVKSIERVHDKDCSIGYFIDGTHSRKRICAKSFAAILGVNIRNVQRMAKRQLELGYVKFFSRGDHKKDLYQKKRESVMEFIGNLEGQESHFCREKSTRIYLPSPFTIKKLHAAYNGKVTEDLNVTFSLFHKIFRTQFNISFKSPATDCCSTCLAFQSRIKNAMTVARKKEIKAKFHEHKAEAAKFYRRLKRPNPNEFLISADCQKGQPLPKMPDGAAYYKRHVVLNHFAVVEGGSKVELRKENVTSFSWTEADAKKGTNEIASCLFHVLNNAEVCGKLEDVDTIVVAMDNTVSTNKSQGMIAQLIYWLVNRAPSHIKKVQK